MPNHPSRNPDQTLRPEIQFSSPAAFQTPFPSDLELRNNIVGSDISKLDSAKSGDPKPLSAKTTSQYASDRSLSNDSFLATLSSMAKAHKNYPQEPTDAPIWASLNKIMGSNISISDPTNKNNASVEDDPTNEVFQSTRSLNTSFANLGQNVVDGSVSLSEPQTLQITAPLIDHQPSIRITKSAAILRTDSDLVGSDPSDPKSQLAQSQSLLPRGNSNLLIGEPILHPSKTDATPIVPSKENDVPHLDQKDSLKVIKSSPDELEQAIDNIFATRRRRRYCFSELFQKLKQNFESYLDPLWHWFKSRFIYLYKTPTCKFWGFTDAIICLLDFYNLISIPYVLAYICDTTLVQISIYFLIDLLLLIDVLLNLHRPVNDQYGQPVIKAHERRLHYLYTRQGWWEVIGSIPIEIIPLIMELGTKDFTRNSIVCRNPIFPPNSSEARWDYSPSNIPPILNTWAYLLLVRFLRTRRSTTRFIEFSLPRMHVAISRLLKNMIVFVYLAHVNSCIFWLIETNLTESNRWIDKAQLSKDPNGIPYPFYYRYPRNFYYGQRALFFVFRDVDLLSEIYFAIFEILIGAICYGSIFGNIAAIIRVMDSKAALDQAAEQRNFMLTGLKHHMISNRFPAKLQEKVLQHEEFGWIQRRGVDVEKFFGHLPRTLHHEICLFLYYDLISAVPIFKSTDDSFKLAIATHITTITVPPNFYIFKQGDSGNEMYFLREGSVDILTGDESKIIVTLKTGAFFGEIALFEDCRRTATARTNAITQLCALSKEDFNAILSHHPTVKEVIQKTIQEKKEADARRKAAEEAERIRKAKEAEDQAAAMLSSNTKLTKIKVPSKGFFSKAKISQLYSSAAASTQHVSQLDSTAGGVISADKGTLKRGGTRDGVGLSLGRNSSLGRPKS